jgi:tight adherence protein B
MFWQAAELYNLLVFGATFGLVISLWFLLVLAWSARHRRRAQQIQRRLGLSDAQPAHTRVLRLWREGHEATTVAPQAPATSLRQRLGRLPQDAGLDIPLPALLLTVLGVATAAAAAVTLMVGSLVAGIGAAATVVILFWIFVQARVARERAKLERQFNDALGLLARSLRAGHPLVGAFQLVAEELEPPVSSLFAEVCQQQALGMGLAEALRAAAEQTSNADVHLFATAVAIQIRSGGNLADLMDRLAHVVRERMRLSRRVRVITAQTQMSKRILLALPVFAFLALYLLNPHYLAPLSNTGDGRLLLGAATVSLLLGWWMMNRMARLRY